MEVYLVFSKTGTWLSNLLRLVLKKKYVHASISFDDSFKEMYSFGRTKPNNPFSGRFVVENLRTGLYKRNKESECIIYKFKVTKEQYDKILIELSKFKVRRNNLKYNFLGLIAAGLNIRIKRKNHYFCTQFVGELLIKSGAFSSEKPTEFFRPEDILLNLKTCEQIYEGYIIDYVTNYDKEN